jgi:hypothetical protein
MARAGGDSRSVTAGAFVNTGAPLIGLWIAHIVFWALLGLGFVTGSISNRSAWTFVVLWLLGYLGIPRVDATGGLFVTPYLALLDIILVLVVLRGDVRLS